MAASVAFFYVYNFEYFSIYIDYDKSMLYRGGLIINWISIRHSGGIISNSIFYATNCLEIDISWNIVW